MTPDPSTYQAFKIWLAQYVPIDRDWLHLALGAVILAMALLALRRHRALRASILAVAIALILGLFMEHLDRRDDLNSLSFWNWGESLTDVLLTISVPLLCFLLVWVRSGNRPDSGRTGGSNRQKGEKTEKT